MLPFPAVLLLCANAPVEAARTTSPANHVEREMIFMIEYSLKSCPQN